MNQAGRMGLSFLFAPVEVLRRVIGWHYRVRGEYVYRCPDTGRTITVKDRMEYDSFTYAPNLRRQDGGPSRAAQVHDVGWNRGTWDPDEWDREYFLSFRQNNDAFRQILLEENPPLPLDSPPQDCEYVESLSECPGREDHQCLLLGSLPAQDAKAMGQDSRSSVRLSPPPSAHLLRMNLGR